jgi:hypothetical protein
MIQESHKTLDFFGKELSGVVGTDWAGARLQLCCLFLCTNLLFSQAGPEKLPYCSRELEQEREEGSESPLEREK